MPSLLYMIYKCNVGNHIVMGHKAEPQSYILESQLQLNNNQQNDGNDDQHDDNDQQNQYNNDDQDDDGDDNDDDENDYVDMKTLSLLQ